MSKALKNKVKLNDMVSVTDYGAVGDGVTDDTVAIQSALSSGALLVSLPIGTYKFSDVSCPTNGGVKIAPSGGLIQFTGAAGIGSAVAIDTSVPGNSIKAFFVHNSYSLGDLMQIKSLGFDTLIHYAQFIGGGGGTIQKVLDNAYALNMRVILASETDSPTLSYDSHPALYGYYLYDEPSTNGITQSAQNTRINAHRALTKKPLCIADFGDFSFSTTILSTEWDIIFVDAYYSPTNTNYNATVDISNRSLGLISWEERKYLVPKAKLIPCSALYTTTGTNRTKNIAYAPQFSRLSTDGSVAFFGWDVYRVYPGTYTADLSSDSGYRAAAIASRVNAESCQPWINETIVCTRNTDLSDLVKVYNPTYSAADIMPFAVINAGSAISERQQTFAVSGICSRNAGGYFATNIKTKGSVWSRFWWTNPVDGATATVVLSESPNDHYTQTVLQSTTIANNANYTNTWVSQNKLLGINVTFTGSYVNRWKTLNTTIINSTWNATSF